MLLLSWLQFYLMKLQCPLTHVFRFHYQGLWRAGFVTNVALSFQLLIKKYVRLPSWLVTNNFGTCSYMIPCLILPLCACTCWSAAEHTFCITGPLNPQLADMLPLRYSYVTRRWIWNMKPSCNSLLSNAAAILKTSQLFVYTVIHFINNLFCKNMLKLATP
jgi:hypothetical protein